MNNTVRMFGVSLFLSLLSASAETLIDLDFSAAGAIEKRSVSGERVKGELPRGWSDDSGFAQVWVEYSFGDEQGTRFLRSHVTRIDREWAQLSIAPLKDAEAGLTYRLSVTCRNRTGRDVDIGLRMRGKPYSFYWKASERFSENWEKHEWEFELARNDAPMGLWIMLHRTGLFDIGALKLERFSKEELIAQLKARHPEGGPANLVQVGRFPLGMPAGWSVSRDLSDGEDVVAESAGGALAPALRIASVKEMTLFSAPVGLIYPIVPHTASLDVRGSGEWEFAVFGHGVPQRSKRFKAEDLWKRVELTFDAGIHSKFCQIWLKGSGELFLDKFQVGPKAAYADKYRSPLPCGVACALAEGYDAGAAGVVFDDERAAVVCALTGDFKDAAVEWRVFDIHAQPVREGRIEAAERVKIKELPSGYGSFRLEARVKRGSAVISPWSEVVWHQLHRPRYWGRDAPRSPFGVHTLSVNRHLVMAKAIGINWTRLHDAGLEYFGWWNLEPVQGEWRFFDQEIRRYRSHGIKILAELGTAPAWASYYQDSGLKSFGYFDKFFQPKNLDDYARYVRVVCERYKGDIDAFDVWNEPWIHAWWGVGYDHSKSGRAGYLTSENAQADFVRLTRLARDTVHSIHPEAQVFGVNTTTSSGNSPSSFGGTQWTQGVLDAGGMEHCDGIAYHCYTADGVGYPGDAVEKGLENAVGPIRSQYGKVPKPLWMTEGSPLIFRMGNGMYNHTLPFKNRDEVLESADRIARYQISMLANGVSRIFLYSMHCHDGRFREEAKQWNVFTTDDGALHPSGAAHAQVAWMLEDTAFAERRQIGSGVYAYLFEGRGRAVAAILSAPDFEPQPIALNQSLRAFDLFGNALTGSVVFSGQVIYVEADALEVLKSTLGVPVER